MKQEYLCMYSLNKERRERLASRTSLISIKKLSWYNKRRYK